MRSSVVPPIGLLVIGLMAFGAAEAQDVTAPTPNSAGEGLEAPSASSSKDRAPSANPLWAIPLRKLTEARDRPLFSPSRRPPPVVVAKAAPPPPPKPTKPPEPEKPQLALVGTVLSAGNEGIGLFLSAANMGSFELKTGQDHQGWVLRAVRPREVELVKGQQVTVLQLPMHEPGQELGKGPGKELGKDVGNPGPLPPLAGSASARLAAPSAAPASVAPAEPSAPPPPAPANGVPEAADQVASAAFPPGITSQPKFKMPKPSDTSSMVNAAVIQPPVIVPPDPLVNPFQKGWIR
jgi:hypothetical protein